MHSESEAMSSNTDSVPLSCSSTYLQAPSAFRFWQLLVLYLRQGFVKGGLVRDLPHDRVAHPNYDYLLAVPTFLICFFFMWTLQYWPKISRACTGY